MSKDVLFSKRHQKQKKKTHVLLPSLSVEYYTVILTTKDIRYLLPEQILYALCYQKQRLLRV